MTLIKLLNAFLFIGLLSFGGGYAVLPLLERVIVDDQGWLTMTTFVDMIAISQITPGPIAINSATFIGFQTTGTIIGAAIATIGVVVLPSLLIGTAAFHSERFKKSRTIQRILYGLRPALVGLIFASVYMVADTAIIDWSGPILIAVYVLMIVKLKIHPVFIVALSGVLGILVYYVI